MDFKNSEKFRYTLGTPNLKTKIFTAEACEPGKFYLSKYDEWKEYNFCLNNPYSSENIFKGFREDAINYFNDRCIFWHVELPDKNTRSLVPSNHLLCSQSFCINSLFPMVNDWGLLKKVFSHYFSDINRIIPFIEDGPIKDDDFPYIVFEWIGKKGTNYLNEKGQRYRGKYATSADFAFLYERHDGKRHLVLGEWKYTESYSLHDKIDIKPRYNIYIEAFKKWKGNIDDFPAYESFFYEPFYQLMRLTLLAQAMEEKKSEMGAEIVSVIHISPKANLEFHNTITSIELSKYGNSVEEIWTRLAPAGRFQAISTEDLLSKIEVESGSKYAEWVDYLENRYSW